MYPQSEQEFIEMTNKLEKEGYINDDYDNLYSEGCKILTEGKKYYILFDKKDVIVSIDNPDNDMEKLLKATEGHGSGTGIIDISGKEFKKLKFNNIRKY